MSVIPTTMSVDHAITVIHEIAHHFRIDDDAVFWTTGLGRDRRLSQSRRRRAQRVVAR